MSNPKNIQVIIPAGGVGTRMGLGYPKQLHRFGNTTVLGKTVSLFQGYSITVAAPEAHLQAFKQALPQDIRLVAGGATRFDSVKNAFEALGNLESNDLVVIHDAARPFFDPSQLDAACALAEKKGAVIFACKATDTVKHVNADKTIGKTLDRDSIFLAQTPQIFKAGLLAEAYQNIPKEPLPTDEAGLLESLGVDVTVMPSSPGNKKLTLAEDVSLLQTDLPRIGHGYDVHCFDPSRPLYLGGIHIPNADGLLGHSDADVLVHALIDALLGAAGLGDIGQWFPDNDPQYEGVRSTVLLQAVMNELERLGYEVGNADVTVMAQAPKLASHIQTMRTTLAPFLKVDSSRMNIKATTTEGLGFVGRKEGIAAQAVVLLSRRHEG